VYISGLSISFGVDAPNLKVACLLLFEGTGLQPPTFENCEKFQAKYCCPNLCDLDNSKNGENIPKGFPRLLSL